MNAMTLDELIAEMRELRDTLPGLDGDALEVALERYTWLASEFDMLVWADE